MVYIISLNNMVTVSFINRKINAPITEPWGTSDATWKAPETLSFEKSKTRRNGLKNTIAEFKLMRDNGMIDSIVSCRKIQHAGTCARFMADGLNAMIAV